MSTGASETAPPPDHAAETIIATVAATLARVPGVAAVALGGSRARGEHHPGSDIDIGIYYEPDLPLDLAALRTLAATLDDRGEVEVTEPGAWGPWINGGAWLRVRGWPVDWLYRDLARWRRALDECLAGRLQRDYAPGHPHGVFNTIYVGELHYARPLYDPRGLLAELKARTMPYPPALKQAVLRNFLWEAGFNFDIGAKALPRNDIAYITGTLYRIVACLTQALFALNERYCINEKGATQAAAGFPICPHGWLDEVTLALAGPEPPADRLARLRLLYDAVVELAETAV